MDWRQHHNHWCNLKFLPIFPTGMRAALAPVILLLAWCPQSQHAMGLCLVIAFLSDVFDGIIARQLGIAAANLRRLDSTADSLFYLAAAIAAWHVHPTAIATRWLALTLLTILELWRYLYDYLKFGREASYHMWSSKLWGIALFAGFFSLLALDADNALVGAAIYLGIVADLEGLVVSAILTTWRADVPTFLHALRVRAAATHDHQE